ncbi:hypothetical protein EMPS_07704 [Entomortierella parvispora]|uniref:S-adenosyl-L-methionine-dependent methyltransferase n=1 Tax=Entomortierella parvispora TaxID=205924 RepID=A0A9P3HEY7_9FUNG|nr:hypothetical protein EMPS_07704 [Entomortierella parvispora]
MSNLQELNNAHFNQTAQDYDNKPQIKVFTQKSTEAILNGFKEATSEERLKNASVLDFGCGTGLCALFTAPQVKHVLGVDASEGMLDYLNHKLTTQAEYADLHAQAKVHTVCHLVTDESPLPEPELTRYVTGAESEGGFDLVYSNFVMHHIEDVQGLINTLSQKLVKKDGWLIISDFEGIFGHGHDGHGHGHGHHHHAEGEKKHDHGEHHHHHHHNENKTEEENKGERLTSDDFKDENGKDLVYVAHKSGFTLEGFEEIMRKAGLVDVKAVHSFGMDREMHGKNIWTDVFVAQGRRPSA